MLGRGSMLRRSDTLSKGRKGLCLCGYANQARAIQTTAKAIEFYNKKVKELEANITDLEKIVQGKSTNLKIIEDGMLSYLPLSNAYG